MESALAPETRPETLNGSETRSETRSEAGSETSSGATLYHSFTYSPSALRPRTPPEEEFEEISLDNIPM